MNELAADRGGGGFGQCPTVQIGNRLDLDDFHALAAVSAFHPAHMNEAVSQFRLFERATLD